MISNDKANGVCYNTKLEGSVLFNKKTPHYRAFFVL